MNLSLIKTAGKKVKESFRKSLPVLTLAFAILSVYPLDANANILIEGMSGAKVMDIARIIFGGLAAAQFFGDTLMKIFTAPASEAIKSGFVVFVLGALALKLKDMLSYFAGLQ